jgi:hypothetical protein
MEPLTALAAQLPLPASLRRNLARYAPRGIIANGKFQWSANADGFDTFSASGALQRVGVAAAEGLPGATGVSGTFDLDQTHGTETDSRDLVLDVPGCSNRLAMASMDGAVTWDKRDGPWRVASTTSVLPARRSRARRRRDAGPRRGRPGTLDARAARGRQRGRGQPLHSLDARRRPAHVAQGQHLEGVASDVRVNLAGDLADFLRGQSSGNSVAVQGAMGRCAFSRVATDRRT